MTQTIRNPAQWAVETSVEVSHHLGDAISTVGGRGSLDEARHYRIRTLTQDDLRDALRMGYADFRACRTDVAALCVLWPVLGFVMAWFAFGNGLIPLIFPMMAGFALLGPVAAVGVYEMSRRREAGARVGWATAFGVIRAPSFGAILALGLALLGLFFVWLVAARTIHALTMGPETPDSALVFAQQVLTTPGGWAMIVLGCGVGFVFAALALAVSVVSFPMLLDRSVGLPTAVVTSLRVTQRNPRVVATWGLIVAVGLALGFATLMIGLIAVLPVLGHATWRLYRRAVVDEAGPTLKG
ncbi:DUF2189 domain-containing protein [Albimonas sp. CAU 1670]|uniref:DUF2189 domain-containing protein n=1 Tax=Albimonas sp. CAU 1670 TaxID=3032599 RepID=UPI0023DC81D4|nr:DUF2189 domain-containing protein [Albimonas sp. CAU 1670]MDF2231731.1 DUF2189 domain-containing protein [Albimonas sp. CAU 1670]